MVREKPRIVITGMGLVSCLGDNIDSFYNALLEGISGISPIEASWKSKVETHFAGQIKDFAPEAWVSKKFARRMDRYANLGWVAGKKALLHANWDIEHAPHNYDLARCGIVVGTGVGGFITLQTSLNQWMSGKSSRLSPFFVPAIIPNITSALLAIDTQFQGPNYAISTACATGAHCIIAAANHIRAGDADLMLCGSSEAGIAEGVIAGFNACHALSRRNNEPTKASRPFDQDRDGFVMAEGGAVLVLESLEHALARKAPILAEYLGGAINTDAYSLTEPRPDGSGISRCIFSALKNAELAPADIDYVNLHATSTSLGDICEIKALKTVFQERLPTILLNATKSLIGHSLGAAGAIEAIVCVEALRRGLLHPTINIENIEAEAAGLALFSEKKEQRIKIALSNSFGFGGHNAVLCLGAFPLH